MGSSASKPLRVALFSAFAFLPAFPSDAVRLSREDGTARSPQLLSVGSAVLVAFEEDRCAWVGIPWAANLLKVAEEALDPKIAARPDGRMALIFQNACPGAPGTWCIRLSERIAGEFEPPRDIASGLESPAEISAAFGAAGALAIAWTELLEEAAPRVVLQCDSKRIELGTGEDPELAVDPPGFFHVAYIRDGRARYRSERLDPGWAAELEIHAPSGVSRLSLAAGWAGEAYLALETGSEIQIVSILDGEAELRAVFSGNAPRLAPGPGATYVLSFLRDGRLWIVRSVGEGASFGEPQEVPIPAVPGPLAAHALAVDSFGWAHFAFEAQGAVYYLNEVPPPKPAFSASPDRISAGEEVSFADLSEGWIVEWSWDFGDGSYSSEPNPRHRYILPGRYRPRLSVKGPGGSGESVSEAEIEVLPAANELRVPRIRASPGEGPLAFPVVLTSSIPIAGYEFALRAPEGLEILGARTGATLTEALGAEFFVARVHADEGSTIEVAALWDYELPFDGRVLLPIEDGCLLYLEAKVSSEVAPGARLELSFLEGYGSEERRTVLVAAEGAKSVFPLARGGWVEIAEGAESFLRGDANRDSAVDISDAIFTLVYLFLGGNPPACPDAADLNDDGKIDVSDPIALLWSLFLEPGRWIPYPFPLPGLDPTSDDLGPCEVGVASGQPALLE